jgi:type I restriction enzyme S subunit
MREDNYKRTLPDGWRWVRIGDVGRFESGGTPSKDNGAFWGGHVPFVTGADITEINISSQHSRAFLSEAGLQTGKTALCLPGTVLFVTRTRVGRVGIATETVAASQDLSPYICGSELIPEFACRYLLSISDHLVANCRGATTQGLTRDCIHALEIPLPPIPEQKRIAAILNEQMAAVEQARAAAEAQLEAAKALPAAYLRAVFSSPEAQQWARRPMGELCEIVARQVDPKIAEYGRLPHVNGESIESGTGRLLSVRTAAEDAMVSGKYLFDANDVLYSKLRPYLRKVTVADFRGVCSADMYPVRVNRSLLDPRYTAWMLLSDEFTNYADAESRRARMPKLNREQLFVWGAPVPSLPEQQRVAAKLIGQMASADRAREAIEEELDTINRLPAALLRRAFTGVV